MDSQPIETGSRDLGACFDMGGVHQDFSQRRNAGLHFLAIR